MTEDRERHKVTNSHVLYTLNTLRKLFPFVPSDSTFPPNCRSLLLPANLRSGIRTLTLFVVDCFFANLTYFTGVLCHRK